MALTIETRSSILLVTIFWNVIKVIFVYDCLSSEKCVVRCSMKLDAFGSWNGTRMLDDEVQMKLCNLSMIRLESRWGFELNNYTGRRNPPPPTALHNMWTAPNLLSPTFLFNNNQPVKRFRWIIIFCSASNITSYCFGKNLLPFKQIDSWTFAWTFLLLNEQFVMFCTKQRKRRIS